MQGATAVQDVLAEWSAPAPVDAQPFDRRLPRHRELAARWLARLHAAGRDLVPRRDLPDRGVNRYRSLLRSVRASTDAPELDVLEFGWSRVQQYCDEFPSTIVHGAFNRNNLRVSRDQTTLFASDWSQAGWGPPLTDLADIDTATYSDESGWSPHQTERAAKMGRVFAIIDAMSRSNRPDRFRRALSRALRDVQWQLGKQEAIEYPDASEVIGALNAVTGDRWTIVRRRGNFYSSTYPSEILTCRTSEGPETDILAKYEAGRFRDMSGHRSGPSYEAGVYFELLGQLPLSSARLYGFDRGWLFIEYIGDAVRSDEAAAPTTALQTAARWAGEFHRLTTNVHPRSINQRRDGYYGSWAQRVLDFTQQWRGRFPWLPQVCERAMQTLPSLHAAPQSVVHGEFTPHNILIRDGRAFPLDWESAAIGPGEIDLASLTDGWPDDVVGACEDEYERARWPEGAPASFRPTLATARLYWQMRWLGNDEFVTARKLARFENLRLLSEQLGLIDA